MPRTIYAGKIYPSNTSGKWFDKAIDHPAMPKTPYMKASDVIANTDELMRVSIARERTLKKKHKADLQREKLALMEHEINEISGIMQAGEFSYNQAIVDVLKILRDKKRSIQSEVE